MGFQYLFWGFLFRLISFPVYGFNIPPAFISYILFIIGLNRLIEYSDRFATSRTLSIILLVLSIFEIYTPSKDISSTFDLLNLINIASGIVNLMLIYQLCKGVAEVALSRDEHQLMETAILRWKLYIWGFVGFIASFFLVFAAPILGGLLVIATMIYVFIIHCLLMGLMRKASRLIQ
ncbi:hypothetical protein E0485_07335 [Paenibacillus albiflavus]|uniref:DUF308 domain-containing protein n=1 Tax=Paenibacillus albiflavus TaxID=2545760 RepID=A0A4R4EFN1_9BACL|nr:hypothetical protein [Paenibacillus albiflavus]TCZ78876.1 hypothetical protein E0485_07335 [Paenibacillus albiflavus]